VRTLELLWKDSGKRIVWDQLNVPLPQRTYGAAIQIVAPELKNEPGLIGAVLTDLRTRGFSNLSTPDISFPQGSQATNLGIEFLKFMLSPANT
jgi:hypothetical protein